MSVPESRAPDRNAADPAIVSPRELEQSIARVSALYHAELRKLDQVLDVPQSATSGTVARVAPPATLTVDPLPDRTALHHVVPLVRDLSRPPRPAHRRIVLTVWAALLMLCLVAVMIVSRSPPSFTGTLPAARAMSSTSAAPTDAAFSALPVLATAVPGATPTAQATPAPTLTAVPVVALPVPATPPAATEPIVPTTAPVARRTPTASATLRQRAVMVEKALRSGRLVATIDYGNGTQATSTLLFDFGGAGNPTVMHLTVLYEGVTGSRTTEFLVVGERYWQRAADGAWVITSPLEGVRGQVSGFLPGLGAVGDDANSDTFHWRDDARDAEVTLQVDPATGIPQRLSRVSATNGTTLTVVFAEWDTPQMIVAPQAS